MNHGNYQKLWNKPQASDFEPITFEARSDPELIIKSVLEHFPYLKFRNSFRGIDNYNFESPQPWSSPCPICNGKHGNYGLHGEWCRNGTEYCLTCFTSSNKFKKLRHVRPITWNAQYDILAECIHFFRSLANTKIGHRTAIWKKCRWKRKFVRNIAQLRWEYSSCDYAFQWSDSGLQVFVPGFFEDHEGTNETDYGINDRILY